VLGKGQLFLLKISQKFVEGFTNLYLVVLIDESLEKLGVLYFELFGPAKRRLQVVQKHLLENHIVDLGPFRLLDFGTVKSQQYVKVVYVNLFCKR